MHLSPSARLGSTYLVGAYAATTGLAPNSSDERALYERLKTDSRVIGLEWPFYGTSDEAPRFSALTHPAWRNVVTTIPGTMNRLAKDPSFGLASNQSEGRREALAFIDQARQSLGRWQAERGRDAIQAIEIHSSPRPSAAVEPSLNAFCESLREISSWDWNGVAIWIEHCDRWNPPLAPAKGFLSLEDELRALDALPPPNVGISINWARSAIETRDPMTPLHHLRAARSKAQLRNLMFSGCTVRDALWGDWADRHAPFSDPSLQWGVASSQLNAQHVTSCLNEARLAGAQVGVKIQFLPGTLAVKERIEGLIEALDFLNRIEEGSRPTKMTQ